LRKKEQAKRKASATAEEVYRTKGGEAVQKRGSAHMGGAFTKIPTGKRGGVISRLV